MERRQARTSYAPSLAGVVVAVVCALVLFRGLGPNLYQVSPTDPVTFVIVSVLVVSMTLVASLVPALRAARTDPVVALRQD